MSRTFRVAVSVALVLGAAVIVGVPPASAISDLCVYDGTTKIATVVFPVAANQNRTVSRGGAAIQYNAAPCGAATVTNTKRIDVFGGDGAQNLTIDLSNGPFAPGAGHETSGLSEIEWQVDLGNGTDGLTVVNGYRKRTYEWSQVIQASLRRGAPWGTLDLSDGTTVSVMGVQGSDGARARRAIREIRAAIAANTPD